METYTQAKLNTDNKPYWSYIFPKAYKQQIWIYAYKRLVTWLLVALVSVYFVWSGVWLGLVGWIVGLLIGWLVYEIDYTIRFVLSGKSNSKELGSEWWGGYLKEINEGKLSLVRSVIFEVFVILLSIYVIMSNQLLLSQGMVVGILGRILWEQVGDFRFNKNISNWFWQIDMEIKNEYQKLFMYLGIGFWVLLVRMVFF